MCAEQLSDVFFTYSCLRFAMVSWSFCCGVAVDSCVGKAVGSRSTGRAVGSCFHTCVTGYTAVGGVLSCVVKVRNPSAGVLSNYCLKYNIWFCCYSVIDLVVFVSLNMEYFSRVSIILPLLVMCMVFMISSMGPKLCPFSRMCWAKLEFPLPCLKSRRCSLKRVLKELPVCPVYFLWHVSWYIPEFSYLSLGGLCFSESSFPMVFLVA
jgi:hypothetical protein